MKIQPIRIDGDRLWDSLMEMAEIGATSKGGCNRQALTNEDRAGRSLFVNWCEEAGCKIKIDKMGNIFARRPGKDNSLSVLAGSHLDTQPTGGKYDGVYGVLAGLEVIRSLNDVGLETELPIEVVCWTNEEGARFSPAMIGSGVWAGEFDIEYGHTRTDKKGKNILDELKRIGYLGEEQCKAGAFKAAYELHIEQGPILEQEKTQIGVVTGVQGMRWYDLIIEGQSCHAGPTPMELRKDPVMGLQLILARLYKLIEDNTPWSRITFGDINAIPGSRNTVPEKIILSVDLRHPDQKILDELDSIFHAIVKQECNQSGLTGNIENKWNSPAVKFDNKCIDNVQQAVNQLGYKNIQMVSGAGHDSVYVSRVAPTSMIFVPCKDGLSHNELENASKSDLEAGCNVLLFAILNAMSN
ncbi:MAG: Zn-dependent hydrolase [Gammaproteobacteria bacterium]|jgi:beta-ureidopropionase / N-carbamoyl-L-amino-acid hydrolase|nr:Zn-dependent hydrolase [Gammaproteobacteria bacterium]